MPPSKSSLKHCPQCSAELIFSTERVAYDFARCSKCGDVFYNDAVAAERKKSIRNAQFSLIFGISSFLLCILTGIPAIIFGIRSLKSRKSPFVQNREWWMAATGIGLGAFLTLALSICIVSSAIPLLAIRGTRVTRSQDDPEKLKAIIDDLYTIEAPEELQPKAAIQIFDMTLVEYSSRLVTRAKTKDKSKTAKGPKHSDEKKVDDQAKMPLVTKRLATVQLEVGHYGGVTPVNNQSIQNSKRYIDIGESGLISQVKSKIESWRIGDKDFDVFVIRGKGSADGRFYRQYIALTNFPEGRFTLYLGTIDESQDEKEFSMTKEQVKNLFHSFKPRSKN